MAIDISSGMESALVRRLQSPLYQKAMQQIAAMDDHGNPSAVAATLRNLYGAAGRDAAGGQLSALDNAMKKARMDASLAAGGLRLANERARMELRRQSLDDQAGDAAMAAAISGVGLAGQTGLAIKNLGLKRKLASQMSGDADAIKLLIP